MNRQEKIDYLADVLDVWAPRLENPRLRATEILNKLFPPLPPVERDRSMERDYIPLPGGFEVQTKGKGSSFRIADTVGDDRMAFGPTSFERDFLTNMAYKIREAYGV